MYVKYICAARTRLPSIQGKLLRAFEYHHSLLIKFISMELILLALVTFFIFYRLSKHLGRVDEDEKKQIEQKVLMMKMVQEKMREVIKEQEIIVGSASTSNKKSQELLTLASASLDEKGKENLQQILQTSKIDLEFFLNGAKSAFEMVLKAFSTGDLETLKMLLSEKLYTGFESAVNQKKQQELTLTTNLITIEKVEIISAIIFENEASISAKFTTKQINYISNKEGMVIEGSKSEIAQINDIWTFKKDLTSPNPNWVIAATG